MTVEEYWKCFMAALRMDGTLLEELTRITMLDVDTEPEDWTTFYEVSEVASRLNIEIDDVYKLIDSRQLLAKDMGDEIFMIPLIAIKEFALYDKKRLLDVPWDKVVGIRPGPMDVLADHDPVKWAALMAEAQYLKRLVDDTKRQGNEREDVEADE